jgi:signal transduction histidine kinase/CheY-like chemotaxis protein
MQIPPMVKKRLAKQAEILLGSSDPQALVEEIEAGLSADPDVLVFKTIYHLYFSRAHSRREAIIAFAMQVYLELHESAPNSDAQAVLRVRFLSFMQSVFMHTYREAEKIEKRSAVTQRVLHHLTQKLDGLLQTEKLMIANISHEMRTALNAISGYVTLLQERGVLQGEEQAFLDKAKSATMTLTALVNDILDISKLSSGEMELKLADFWLDEAVLQSLDTVMLQAEKKQLPVRIGSMPPPCRLFGDANRIISILTNLLTNAVKFTDQGEIRLEITMRAEREQAARIEFCVRDTGCGMSPEQCEKVFQPYTRFKKERQGAGLGLYISRELSRKMGGDLSVESAPGEGSRFCFSVRLESRDEAPVAMDDAIICFFDEHRGGSERIALQKKALLEQWGAAVICFDDEKALTKYLLDSESGAPDVVSFTAANEHFYRLNALVHYLKSDPKFDRTCFMAEYASEAQELNYFNRVFERFAPVSSYISAVNDRAKQAIEASETDARQLRVLAVDDIETNLEVLKLFIGNAYPEVRLDLAAGGYEAVGMYKTAAYDLVLLDLKMPGLNGFEVLKKLQTVRTLPAVYALTADVYKETYDKVMQAGFDGLLEKPLQPERLFDVIEKTMVE